MVLGAIVIRAQIDSDADDSTDSSDGPLSLICGPELLTACNDLASETDISVSIEPEHITALRLSSGDLTLDGSTAWLAAGPWPEVTRDGGAEMPNLAASEILARSPAVIVALTNRIAAVQQSCGAVTWACIGEAAGGQWSDLGGESGWGRVEVGLPEPESGDGMVAVNQAVASRVGRTDFAANDLDDPAVAVWFGRLATESKANSTSISPLTQFLRVPGSLGVVGALESDAETQLASAATADTITVVTPEPRSTADVQLWASDEDTLAAALEHLGTERLGTALEAAGWRLDDDSASGLPTPGVISAVNTRWENT